MFFFNCIIVGGSIESGSACDECAKTFLFHFWICACYNIIDVFLHVEIILMVSESVNISRLKSEFSKHDKIGSLGLLYKRPLISWVIMTLLIEEASAVNFVITPDCVVVVVSNCFYGPVLVMFLSCRGGLSPLILFDSSNKAVSVGYSNTKSFITEIVFIVCHAVDMYKLPFIFIRCILSFD